MNLVDSSGWIEFFGKGENAHLFLPVIRETNELIVSTINLYEVFKWVRREKGETAALYAITTMEQARVVEVDREIALTAAGLSADLKIPMADSIILATARLFGATLWTQDADFEGMPDVRYFPKER